MDIQENKKTTGQWVGNGYGQTMCSVCHKLLPGYRATVEGCPDGVPMQIEPTEFCSHCGSQNMISKSKEDIALDFFTKHLKHDNLKYGERQAICVAIAALHEKTAKAKQAESDPASKSKENIERRPTALESQGKACLRESAFVGCDKLKPLILPPNLIDRDDLLEILGQDVETDSKQRAAQILECILNAPTVDPVRAAGGCRCGECKHRNDHGHCAHPRHEILPTTYPNDFCSYGELMGGEDDG